jgi:hypothetical protein
MGTLPHLFTQKKADPPTFYTPPKKPYPSYTPLNPTMPTSLFQEASLLQKEVPISHTKTWPFPKRSVKARKRERTAKQSKEKSGRQQLEEEDTKELTSKIKFWMKVYVYYT